MKRIPSHLPRVRGLFRPPLQASLMIQVAWGVALACAIFVAALAVFGRG